MVCYLNLNLFLNLIVFYFSLLVLTTLFRSRITYYAMFFIFIIFFIIIILECIVNFKVLFFSHNSQEIRFFIIENFNINFDISIYLRLDGLSFMFSLLVLVIGLATNIYILVYFKHEASIEAFYLYINWFIFSMNIFLLANNVFTLILGWELIGLFSFLLINFWSIKKHTLKCSFKAFFFNQISDIFLLIFIIIILKVTGISNIYLINIYISNCEVTDLFNLKIAAVCLIICSSIKSAQLFFHIWLPDSMEAPVPASALIHSATLVSAGVYLLMRFNSLLNTTDLEYLLVWIGAFTGAYGGVVSAMQTDMKKVLAYSTISHCGFMFVCIGIKAYSLLFIYFYLHGLFKAGSFFICGNIIRFTGTQDIRQMGTLSNSLPLDTIWLLIFISNLIGLPFTFGSLYKNLFISTVISSSISPFNIVLVFIGTLSSIVYGYRLIYYSCFDFNKSNKKNFIHSIQSNYYEIGNYYSQTTIAQNIALFILLAFSIYIYCIFTCILLNSGLNFELYSLCLPTNKYTNLSPASNYSLYKLFFYFIYIMIWIYIYIVAWREEYTYPSKLSFFTFLVQLFLFLFLILKFNKFIQL